MKKIFALVVAIIVAAQLPAPALADGRSIDPRSESRRSARSTESRSESERHQDVASERIEDYFTYEYQIGSNAIKVTSSKVSPEETLPVQGWHGRFRTTGKAYIEYFDSQTRTFGRLSRHFEIVTEEKNSGAIKVEALRVR